MLVVVNDRLGGGRRSGSTNLGRRCRRGCSDRCRDCLDDSRLDGRRQRFGLGFHLDDLWGSFLGGGFLRRRIGWCRRGLTVGRLYSLGRSCLLRRALLRRLRFLGLFGSGQTVTNGATLQPIGLCLDQGAGVGLHANTHCFAQRHHFGVGHSELLGELVHAHVFRQNLFSLSLASACRSVFRRPLSLSCW
jgi:hypothetical protein